LQKSDTNQKATLAGSDGTSQQTSSLSRATLGFSFSSPRLFLVYFIPKILYTSIFTAEGSQWALIFTTKMIFV
jgi:hypothetical protein